MNIEALLASGVLPTLRGFVAATKLHPILVNFTAALVPVSIGCDAMARLSGNEALRHTACWTLIFATAITPLTALTGWLFWMADDAGSSGMAIHKWLGTGLAALLFGLFGWRARLRAQNRPATIAYLLSGLAFVAALVLQGYLGGTQVFGGM
jgi:uncharacterized membrane protein